MRDYPQLKSVLMVTYRITLAYEFESVFSNYKNGDFQNDNLINQTESLLRIADNTDKLKNTTWLLLTKLKAY